MTKILGFMGPAESGKDSLARFLIRNSSELWNWKLYSGYYISRYALADYPKDLASELLNIPRHLFDTGKDTLTRYTQQDLTWYPQGYTRYLTVREVIQYYFEFLRRHNPNIFVNKVLTKIKEEKPFLAVITDIRRKEESDLIRAEGGKIIKLTRRTGNESWRQHVSETEQTQITDIDAIIDNQSLSLYQTEEQLVNILKRWGWISEMVQ